MSEKRFHTLPASAKTIMCTGWTSGNCSSSVYTVKNRPPGYGVRARANAEVVTLLPST
jgi:hypothetical protein